jgi:phosphodiesterase/alkaline phosphatase D-like protein
MVRASTRAKLACALIAAASLLVIAAPAQAASVPPHTLAGSFAGSGGHAFTDPSGLVVDQATHTVYAADRPRDRVLKFDLSGNFILMFGGGVNQTTGGNLCTAASGDTCGNGSNGTGPGQFVNIRQLGIDNSEGPSAGSVYVGDVGAARITKFASNGQQVTDFGASGVLSGFPGGITSMTVDHEGFIWVLLGQGRFAKYDRRGILDKFVPRNEDLGTSISQAQMAADSLGIIAFSNGFQNARKAWGGGITRAESNLGQFTTGGSGFGIDPATDDLYVAKGNRVASYPNTCNPELGECAHIEEFGNEEFFGAEGVGIDSQSGRVFVAANTGIFFYDGLKTPDVFATAIPSYTPTTATVHAEIDPAGGGDVTGCTVEFGLTTAYGSSVPCDQTMPSSNPLDVSATLPGLTPESLYHYRFVAANANGSTRGKDRVVTPHHVQSITTDPATNVGPGTATLNGTFDPDQDPTNYYFEWGTTTAYGNVTSAPPGSGLEAGSDSVPVSVVLDEGLTGFTTYHYRLVATNSSGTSYGEDRTFTTGEPIAPTVEGTSVSGIEPTSATFHATIKPGFGPTAFRFQYGPSVNFGATTVFGPSIGDDNSSHEVSEEVTDLNPGTTYHYRVIAINFGGTTKSVSQSFTTPDRPGIGGLTVEVTSPTTALFRAAAVPNLAATSVRFGYGNASVAESTTGTFPVGGLDMLEHPLSTAVGGLSPNTPYFAQAFASNEHGDSQSSVVAFRTPPLPQVVEEQKTSAPKRCKRGFVKKRGKCVKKKKAGKRSRRGKKRGGTR